jgi:hypothetical protein
VIRPRDGESNSDSRRPLPIVDVRPSYLPRNTRTQLPPNRRMQFALTRQLVIVAGPMDSRIDTLTFYTFECICRSHRHEDGRQIRSPAGYPRFTHHEGGCAWPDSRLRDRAKDSANVSRGLAGPTGIPLSRSSSPRIQKAAGFDWELSETGREAKFYELTANGRAYLKAETELEAPHRRCRAHS